MWFSFCGGAGVVCESCRGVVVVVFVFFFWVLSLVFEVIFFCFRFLRVLGNREGCV